MKIDAFIEEKNEKKVVTLPREATITDLLKELKINPVTVVVSKNGSIVAEDTLLKEKDRVDIFAVISGG